MKYCTRCGTKLLRSTEQRIGDYDENTGERVKLEMITYECPNMGKYSFLDYLFKPVSEVSKYDFCGRFRESHIIN